MVSRELDQIRWWRNSWALKWLVEIVHASSSHGSDIQDPKRAREKRLCSTHPAAHKRTVVPNTLMRALLIQWCRIFQHHSCSDNAKHVQMPNNQRKYSNAKQPTKMFKWQTTNEISWYILILIHLNLHPAWKSKWLSVHGQSRSIVAPHLKTSNTRNCNC